MILAGMYSFKGGKEIIESRFASELRDVKEVIAAVDSRIHKTKVSRERTKLDKILYSPDSLNRAFRQEFEKRRWKSHRVLCEYPTQYYTSGFTPSRSSKGAYRDMDFVKNRVGVEVQFGKYAFMVYNVCAKMTIFHNLDVIDVGIEIVPVKDFVIEMSSGVSYFEQFVWDLQQRGVADIDIPVLILGIAV
ncbi:MAG TPA: BglII/BstYI family type II restriction endonuclease [Anaerolineae bacterium]|nr:BglII/BstYI family type II restriction endonuclease [Anaerolineae bacterium]